MVLGNRLGNSLTRWNFSSTLDEAITIVSSSLSLKSVTSSQLIFMAADRNLACVLSLCHTVSGYHCMFDGCIVMGSLEAEICAFAAHRAGSHRIMSHPERCAT